MARATHRKVEGEEQAIATAVRLATRCQGNYPDKHPIGILIAAVSNLRLAGWSEPKDGHILHAADRIVEALQPPEKPEVDYSERRHLTGKAAAQHRKLVDLWAAIQPTLRRRLFESAYRMWIQELEIAGAHEGTILLWAKGDPIRTWVERRYLDVIIEAIEDCTGKRPAGVRFVNWRPELPDTTNTEKEQQ